VLLVESFGFNTTVLRNGDSEGRGAGVVLVIAVVLWWMHFPLRRDEAQRCSVVWG
jgi:hypothetical protein